MKAKKLLPVVGVAALALVAANEVHDDEGMFSVDTAIPETPVMELREEQNTALKELVPEIEQTDGGDEWTEEDEQATAEAELMLDAMRYRFSDDELDEMETALRERGFLLDDTWDMSTERMPSFRLQDEEGYGYATLNVQMGHDGEYLIYEATYTVDQLEGESAPILLYGDEFEEILEMLN